MTRFGVLVALALALAACGGSIEVKPPLTPDAAATPVPTPPRGGTPVTLADIAPFTKTYLRTTWNYLASTATARSLYDLFTPECQRTVSLAALERTPAVVQSVYKGLQGKTVEEVEFAVNLSLRPSADGALEVRLPLSSQTRFRIDGNWLTEYEWVRQLNPAAALDKSDTLSLTPSGDSFRVANCQLLRQWDRG